MGFNTVAFFLNDQCDQVERDPQTLPRLMRAMSSGSGNDDQQYMTVLPSVHADGTQIVLAGGNRITPLGIMFGRDHSEEALIRELARRLGYSLRKKRAALAPSDLASKSEERDDG